MTINFKCPACNAPIHGVPDAAAGRQGKCNKCGSSVRVPSPSSFDDDDILSLLGPPIRDIEPPQSFSESSDAVEPNQPHDSNLGDTLPIDDNAAECYGLQPSEPLISPPTGASRHDVPSDPASGTSNVKTNAKKAKGQSSKDATFPPKTPIRIGTGVICAAAVLAAAYLIFYRSEWKQFDGDAGGAYVVVSPAGTRILTVGGNQFQMWNTATRKQIYSGKIEADTVVWWNRDRVRFSDDSQSFVVVAKDGLHRIDTESGTTLDTRSFPEDQFYFNVTINKTGRYAFVCYVNKQERNRHEREARARGDFQDISHHAGGGMFDRGPPRRFRFETAYDLPCHIWELWDLEQFKVVRTLHTNAPYFAFSAISPDGTRAVQTLTSGGGDGGALKLNFQLWNLDKVVEISRFSLDVETVGYAITPNCQTALVNRSDAAAVLIDLATGKELKRLEGKSIFLNSTFSDDGRYVTLEASAILDREVSRSFGQINYQRQHIDCNFWHWDIVSGTRKWEHHNKKYFVGCMTYDSKGDNLFTVGTLVYENSNKLRVWRLPK